MAETTFNIKRLYGGVKWNLPFAGAIISSRKAVEQYSIGNFISPQALGVPIYGKVELGGIKFAIPPTFVIRKSLNVTKTGVYGADGTVKEVGGWNDWEVNLKCFLTNNEVETFQGGDFKVNIQSDNVPEDRVRELVNLVDTKKSLLLVNEFMNMVGIQYLLVEEMSFPELDDYTSIIPVELRCVSDKPLEIRLNQ